MKYVGAGVPDSPKRDALSYRASPLRKQFTGLFSDSPLAERLRFFGLRPNPPEALPLDSAKGTQSLWNPVRGLGKHFG